MLKSKLLKSGFSLVISFSFLFLFSPETYTAAPDNTLNPSKDVGIGSAEFYPEKVEKGFWLKLNDRQKRVLRRAIKELKEQGAPPQEIKALIKQYLEKWGIKPGKKHKVLKGFWKKLTKAQREELHQAIKELKAQGASKKEIKALIKEYLKGWGIKPGK